MGYILLWVESLTAALLLAAVGIAWAAQRERRWQQIAAALTSVVLLAAPAVVVLWITWHLEFNVGLTYSWFFWALAWNAALATGVLLLLRAGLRREGEPASPPARDWPLLRLALAGGVALLLLLSTFTIMDTGARTQVGALRSEAGALVLATAPQRVPDRDNAALLYQEAFDALLPQEKLSPGWKDRQQSWLDLAQPISADDAELRAYLERQAPALDLLRQAGARPGCYFQREYDQIYGSVADLGQLRQGSQLLALDARYRAKRGEREKAVADIVALHQMARHVSSDPILIAYLVAVYIDGLARETLSVLLGGSTVPPEELVPLTKLDPVFFRPVLQRALQREQALALSIYTTLAEGNTEVLEMGAEGNVPAALAPPIWRLFLMAEDVAAYREAMRRIAGVVSRPYPIAADAWPAGQNVMEVRGLVVRMVVPALHRISQSPARADASRRLLPLAVAVAKYRHAKGKYPAQLDELVPKFLPYVPTDPYTGEPMKLAVKDAGVIVYSVGPDLKDDGGQEIKSKQPPLEGDVAIHIGTEVPADKKAN